jgi:hypothetical protein
VDGFADYAFYVTGMGSVSGESNIIDECLAIEMKPIQLMIRTMLIETKKVGVQNET